MQPTKEKSPPLIPIQPAPQIPCTPHQLLILVLLHLQLPLPLHADREHLATHALLLVPHPALAHALPERCGRSRLLHVLQRRTVRNIRYLAAGGRALLDRQRSCVRAVLRLRLWRQRRGVLGHGHGRCGGVEGLVAPRQDVLREGDRVLAVEVGDVVWLGGEGGAEGLVGTPAVLLGGAVEGAHGVRERREDVGHAVRAGCEDCGEGSRGYGFREGCGHGDGAVQREER